jgi:Tfp pilus assembly protein PilW
VQRCRRQLADVRVLRKMRRLRDRVVRRARSESGFTLVELLFSSMIGLMLIAVGVTIFTATVRSQPGAAARGVSIQEARNVMERMTREIRQGSTVYPSTSTQLSMLTMVHSASCGGAQANTAIRCKVTYTCSAGNCTRVEAPPPPTTTPISTRTVVTGLSNSTIFSYTPTCGATTTSGSPGYVCVNLVFPGDHGDDALTVQDGAAPNNPTS